MIDSRFIFTCSLNLIFFIFLSALSTCMKILDLFILTSRCTSRSRYFYINTDALLEICDELFGSKNSI